MRETSVEHSGAAPHAVASHGLHYPRAGRLERAYVVVSLLLLTGGASIVLGQAPVTEIPDTAAPDGLPANVLFGLVYAVAIVLMVGRSRDVIAAARRDGLVVAIVVLAALSTLWSPATDVTLRKVAALALTTVFAYYLTARFSVRELLVLLGWTLAIAMLLSAAVAVVAPGAGLLDGGVRGIFYHRNIFGRVASLAVIVFFVLSGTVPRRRIVYLLAAGGSLALVILSDSKTPLAVLVCLAVLYLFLRTFRWERPAAAFCFLLLVLVVGIALTIFVTDREPIVSALGKDTTLTGRTQLWDAVTSMIHQRPLLGYGYYGFWQGWEGPSAYVWRRVDWFPPHSHSGFLDLLLDLGVVGTAVFLVQFLRSWLRGMGWLRSVPTALGAFPLLFFSFVALNTVTESVLMRPSTVFWVLYVYLAVAVSRGARSASEPLECPVP